MLLTHKRADMLIQTTQKARGQSDVAWLTDVLKRRGTSLSFPARVHCQRSTVERVAARELQESPSQRGMRCVAG
jgi:hypothetical protein